MSGLTEVRAWQPNPRAQRTRSLASLRGSPLTRRPLGRVIAQYAFCSAVLLVAAACKQSIPVDPPGADRAVEGRPRAIEIQDWVDKYERATHGASPILLNGEIAAGSSVLHLTLTNLSEQVLELYPFELPWGNPNSISLFALSTGGSLLGQVHPIADPGPESRIQVPPRGSVGGDIDLEKALEGFRNAQAKSDLVVVWQYQVLGSDKTRLPVVTGVAVAKMRKSTS